MRNCEKALNKPCVTSLMDCYANISFIYIISERFYIDLLLTIDNILRHKKTIKKDLNETKYLVGLSVVSGRVVIITPGDSHEL